MVIDPLLTVLKTPIAPREVGSTVGWGDVGRRIGEVLPGDYMKFIELYGTGTIGGWLTARGKSRAGQSCVFVAGSSLPKFRVFPSNTRSFRRLDPATNPRRLAARDFHHGLLRILNAFASNPHQNLLVAGFRSLAGLRAIKRQLPDEVPFPLFYEPDGLLPWGISIDSDIFCWSTRGLSGHWTVVIIGRHTGNEEFAMPMTQFLFEALAGKLNSRCIPRDIEATFAS